MTTTPTLSKIVDLKDENPDDFFVWQDYLDATNSREVPQHLFGHVELSLQSGFQEGMKVQVPLKDDLHNYWVASIITACGPLLSLRYVGDKEDRSKDFWCDMSKVDLRPLGWAESNGKILVPPAHLNETISHKDLKAMLRTARTFSSELINADGFTPVDRIKQGMKVEVQDKRHPYHVWIATVIENVGGRLLLRYDCPDTSTPKDFWLFYSSPRIFVVGWAQNKGAPWKYAKPSCCIASEHGESEWQAILEMSKEEARKLPLSTDIFQSGHQITFKHTFTVGMKLEAVHPQNRAQICPATVVKIFDDTYFLVALDDITRGTEKNDDGQSSCEENNEEWDHSWLSTVLHPYIFPCGWAKKSNVKLTHPRGWISDKEEFDWKEYLEKTDSKMAAFPSNKIQPVQAAELGFEDSMKLEVVNPDNEDQICAASVSHMKEHLVWIHLDSADRFQPDVIFCVDSLEMFPMGWCEMNNFPLKPPQSFNHHATPVEPLSDPAETEPQLGVKVEDLISLKDIAKMNGESKGSFWCPKIFFNHKCFSGPFLSKGKLAQLPKAVGPGPVTLVMKEVLSMLISVAYISSRVLRELQCKSKPKAGMHLEVLKAKYKSNAYRGNVEIVTSADKVNDFCKEICSKLQVCPYLFGPISVGEKSCPENCSTLSKTRFLKKYSNNNNSNNNSENSANNTIKKETLSVNKRFAGWPRRKRTLEKDYLSGFGKIVNDNDGVAEKRTRYETRGVKLPNFGLKKPNGNSNRHPSSASETSSIASTQNESHLTPKKRGRYSKVKKEELKKAAEMVVDSKMDDSLYQVDSNPLLWTVEDLYDYLKGTDDCDVLANLLKSEEFDGKSFMLLNLPSCLNSLKLNLKAALGLCRHVEAVKFTFFRKYVIPTSGSMAVSHSIENSVR